MALKKYIDGAWQDVGSMKRHNGTDWQDCDSVKKHDGSNWVDVWGNKDIAVQLDLYCGISLSNITVYLSTPNSLYYARGTTDGSGFVKFVAPDLQRGQQFRVWIPRWDYTNVKEDTYSPWYTYLTDGQKINLHILSYTGVKQTASLDIVYLLNWSNEYNISIEDFEGEHSVNDGIELTGRTVTYQVYSDSEKKWVEMPITAYKMDGYGSKDKFGYPSGYRYYAYATTQTYYSYGPWRFRARGTGNIYEKIWT